MNRPSLRRLHLALPSAAACLLLTHPFPEAAQAFGDDNPSGEWLPIPDDYEWPSAVEPAPDFSPGSVEFNGLAPAIRSAIQSFWPEDSLPETVRIAWVDLNADGRDECFVGVPAYGGSGGPYYEILSSADGATWRDLGGLQGSGFRFLKPENGWLQIESKGRGGGGHYSRCLLTCDKSRYRTSRNEGHDFNTGTVTIRPPEAAPVAEAEIEAAADVEADAPAATIDPLLAALRTRLENALGALQPPIAIEIPDGFDGKSLILRYQTRIYRVYPRNKTGRLGRELIDHEGPDDEGLLLRVHVQPKGDVNQAVLPQTLREPYWSTDLALFPIERAEKQFYVALSYRGLTDNDLLQKLKDLIEAEAASPGLQGQ